MAAKKKKKTIERARTTQEVTLPHCKCGRGEEGRRIPAGTVVTITGEHADGGIVLGTIADGRKVAIGSWCLDRET